MEEYLSRADVIETIKKHKWVKVDTKEKEKQNMMADEMAFHIYKDITPADVAPVIHSKWIEVNKEKLFDFLGDRVIVKSFKCENCGRMIHDIGTDGLTNRIEDYPYCHCGAKMDKE